MILRVGIAGILAALLGFVTGLNLNGILSLAVMAATCIVLLSMGRGSPWGSLPVLLAISTIGSLLVSIGMDLIGFALLAAVAAEVLLALTDRRGLLLWPRLRQRWGRTHIDGLWGGWIRLGRD